VKTYKERYWNAIGGDNLPDEMKGIALDTAINFGPAAANQMIQKSGVDPVRLAELRREKHQSLIKSNPTKYGKNASAWEERDDHWANVVGAPAAGAKLGNEYDMMSPDARAKLMISTQKALVAQEKAQLKLQKDMNKASIEDPAGYAVKYAGAQNIDDIVMVQAEMGIPERDASILPKDTAKQMVSALSHAETLDQFLVAKQQLKQASGDYFNNAVKDLDKNGLPKSSRLLLSMDDTEDSQTMQALMTINRAKDKEISTRAQEEYKRRGDNTFSSYNSFRSSTLDKAGDWLDVQAAAGMPVDDINFMTKNIQDLADYYYANGDSAEDAQTKATAWLTSGMTVASMNNRSFFLPVDLQPPEEPLLSFGMLVPEIPFSNTKQAFKKTPQDLLQTRIKNLSTSNVYMGNLNPEWLPQAYLKDIQYRGGWVNSPDGSGLNLIDGNGEYVLDKTRTPITMKYDTMRAELGLLKPEPPKSNLPEAPMVKE
jgi:hypothetical protein